MVLIAPRRPRNNTSLRANSPELKVPHLRKHLALKIVKVNTGKTSKFQEEQWISRQPVQRVNLAVG